MFANLIIAWVIVLVALRQHSGSVNGYSVVTWGHQRYGGNSSAVASELASNVVNITSTDKAFAARKRDGSVVSWGMEWNGGDGCCVLYISYAADY